MRKLNALAACAACVLAPVKHAAAATVQLDSSSFNGSGYTYVYGGTLAPTEGVKNGSELVVVDFAGYVAGSISSPYADITATTELTTSGIMLPPGVTDDPTIPNLVFTYTGADFQTTPAGGTPYSPISFTGLSAGTTLGGQGLDGFSTLTVKNDGTGVGTTVYSAGLVAVPALAAVPEPGSWALMLVGMGAVGLAARRHKRVAISYS